MIELDRGDVDDPAGNGKAPGDVDTPGNRPDVEDAVKAPPGEVLSRVRGIGIRSDLG